MIKQFIHSYLNRKFFVAILLGITLVGLSHFLFFLFYVGISVICLTLIVLVVDLLLLYQSKNPFTATRKVPERMHLGDSNVVELWIKNTSIQTFYLEIHEGYPEEMQARGKYFTSILSAESGQSFEYEFQPKKRGELRFGEVQIFCNTAIGLASRKINLPLIDLVKVYPSVLQMKQYELKVFNQQTQQIGIKRVRRIGNTSEYEQIRSYIQGDDQRTINWKASSKRNEIMVNQYQEERSQSVYCIIDKSRPMQHYFDGMNLLDYSINSALVLSNIALRKGDKSGLLTFSNKIGTLLPADKSIGQLRRIQDALYMQQTHFLEADYALLYEHIRSKIKTRSLLLLFTNFDNEFAMQRALSHLQQLNKRHVLVVIFFTNNELDQLSKQTVETKADLIKTVVADKFKHTKWKIARQLRQHGIHTILTKPEELSAQSINKYLELKAKGLI